MSVIPSNKNWAHVSIEVCVCVCVKALKQHSLPQSNKGENGDIVAHTNDEDEPQGKGEVFHVSQLYHFTWHWRSTHIQISPRAELAGNNVNLQVNLECWFDVDNVKNKQSPVVTQPNLSNYWQGREKWGNFIMLSVPVFPCSLWRIFSALLSR